MFSVKVPRISFVFATAFTYVVVVVSAVTTGGFEDGGSTLVSAMMMFLGNENSVYVLDKAEANAAQINGHPAWGSLWDIKTRKALAMDVKTNSFCASGMHLPNGSYVTFGGNDAVTTGGAHGSQKYPDGQGFWDSYYQDFDGRKAIRIVNPCTISDNLNSGSCAWYDGPDGLMMKKMRWYSTAEATGEGQVVIIGGMVNGGYVNRWVPNVDPATEAGQAEPTYEYFPAKDATPQQVNFIVKTSGLNAYPHAFLMPSGRILLQANLSTTLWDHNNNTESDLPNMPNGVIRVYPASGATTMLPLTPANNWTPTILFCGGSAIADEDWGDYVGPKIDAWTVTASKDCQRLTPEPSDGSQPVYVADDDMLEPRTMGQFIYLPTGQLLLVNGGQKGTAGYSNRETPYNISLAAEPVYTPAIYNPNASKGSRWSNQGFSASTIARLYHSTAVLLPDGSVLVAGSNPNSDVNLTVIFPTQYKADIFYPSYFSASVRPGPQNLPSTLSYGGSSFDITVPSSSYTGNANDAADATIVTIVRSGFTTHAMNMGQRFMQLNNTYTVNSDGSITLHVAQLPPNPNLFQPGPALLYVCINGIPSTGKYVIIGSGNIGPQPTAEASQLPASVRYDGSISSSSGSSPTSTGSSSASSRTVLIGGIAGTLAVLALIGIVAGIFFARRKKQKRAGIIGEKQQTFALEKLNPLNLKFGGGAAAAAVQRRGSYRDSNVTQSTVFAPLSMNNRGGGDGSEANLNAPYLPYKDDAASSSTPYSDYDPYSPFYPSGLSPAVQPAGSMTNVVVGFGGDAGGVDSSTYSVGLVGQQQQQSGYQGLSQDLPLEALGLSSSSSSSVHDHHQRQEEQPQTLSLPYEHDRTHSSIDLGQPETTSLHRQQAHESHSQQDPR